MKKLIMCVATMVGIMGFCMTAQARTVTTLEMDCGNGIEVVDTIQGVVEVSESETEPETVEVKEEVEVPTVEEVETFTGNYGSSDEDEWVDMEPEDCPEHIWEYSYDDSEDEIVYFRFCLNCGYTEYLDYCPEGLEYTLPDYVETDESKEVGDQNENTEI